MVRICGRGMVAIEEHGRRGRTQTHSCGYVVWLQPTWSSHLSAKVRETGVIGPATGRHRGYSISYRRDTGVTEENKTQTPL